MHADRQVPAIELPEGLAAKMASFERRLRRVETALAALVGLSGLLLTYGAVLASDRIWDTPAWCRLVLTSAGGLVAAVCAFWWLRHWCWRRRDARELAKLVQKRFGRLGDRLLGIVELAEVKAMPGHMSEALCRAAMRQVESDAARYDFREAASGRKAWRWGIGVGAAVVLVAVVVLLAPEAGRNALARWLRPLAKVERYTFARVQDLPAEQVVPHGEPFEIACRLADGSRWRPGRAVCRIGEQPPVEAAVTRGVAVFRLPGQTVEGVLSLRLGDAFKQMTIRPLCRPELVAMAAQVRLPAYLERSVQTNRVESGTARVVEGAQLRLVGTVSRALGSAAVDGNAPAVEVDGARFSTVWCESGAATNCVFRWMDRFGLACAKPFAMRIESVADAAPAVECAGLAPAVAILQDETLRFKAMASDDFGLREMRMEMTLSTGARPGETARARRLKEGRPDALSLESEIEFSALTEHIPEDSQVIVRIAAEDYRPGREPSRSEAYRILVLSRAQHAKLLAAHMDELLGRMDDMARAEEELLGRNREIAAKPAEDLLSPKSEEEVRASEEAERRQSERMADLLRELKSLTSEALRNREIPAQLMRQCAQAQAQGESLQAGEWSRAKQALADAAAQPNERAAKTKDAATEEENIVKALREMARQLNASVEDTMAASLAGRLRKVARTEGETAKTMLATAGETVGLTPEQLPSAARDRLNRLAEAHDGARGSALTIQDDVAGFYKRTRKPAYGEVYEGMVSSRTGERMAEAGRILRMNRHEEAARELVSWQAQFDEWAAMLSGKKKNDRGQGGGESGESGDEELFLELARMLRREESIREQTRGLEQTREDNRSYKDDAIALGGSQDELASDMRELTGKTANPSFKRFGDAIGDLMNEATIALRKPATDSATVAIETEVIEALAGAMSQCSSGSGQCAALSRMLGMGRGSSGGGSMAGGAAEGANVTVSGRGVGAGRESREVRKSGGADAKRWPEEYRSALQLYFKAMEEGR